MRTFFLAINESSASNLRVGARLTTKQFSGTVCLTFGRRKALLNEELDKPLEMCPRVSAQFIKISFGE